MRGGWTHSICSGCFKKREPGREPARLKEPESETCVYCGACNEDGIYTREDPRNVALFAEQRKRISDLKGVFDQVMELAHGGAWIGGWVPDEKIPLDSFPALFPEAEVGIVYAFPDFDFSKVEVTFSTTPVEASDV